MSEPRPGSGADPLLGTLLGGRYRLLDVVGHGGSGRVYRAVQEAIGREVAVKVLHAGQDGEGAHDLQARFLREAALAGRIQHPHVVTMHDYGRTPEGACYIVMEHLRGRTLRSLLRDGPLPLPRALRIFEQLLLGLRAAHRAGLVHRDVKPSNVILLRSDDGGDFVKLFDFGLVKGDDETTITQHGVFMGTPQYVSPEQARGGVSDARSDLYSAGVILFRMVTGTLPFSAETPMAVAWKHVHEPLPTVATIAPQATVPAVVEELVRELLEKEPGKRPADVDAALARLVEVREALGMAEEGSTLLQRRPPEDAPSLSSIAGVGTVELEEPPELALDRPSRGGPVALAVLVAVLVLLGTVTVLLLRRPGQQAPAVPAVVQGADAPATGEGSPSPEEAPPAVAALGVREVVILISSDPSGAEVWQEGLQLGTTPMARSIAVDDAAGEGGARSFRLHLAGHHDATVTLDLDQATAAANAVLAPLAGHRGSTHPASSAAAASSASSTSGAVAVVADDVRFSSAQAAATLALVNEGDEDTLRAAGVAPRQVGIILAGRPFSDLGAFAATPWIGQKTLEHLRDAATR